MEAGCIIVCEGAGVSLTIRKLAQERGCTVITTPYDTYTTARLINQSMPISYFMTMENIIGFSDEDPIDDIRDIMANKRHRDFPILDSDGKYLGMISRRNLLGAKGKHIILVDHNERTQGRRGYRDGGYPGDHRPSPSWNGADHVSGIFQKPASGLYGYHHLPDVPGK